MLTFLALKSLSMLLNGLRGIALAASLGPQGYGLLGTLIVLQQYMSYIALGMREGVAIKLVRSSGTSAEKRVIYSSGLLWGACSGLLSVGVLAGLHWFWNPIADFWLWVGLTSLLSILNEICININRYENKLRKVAAIELVYTAVALALVVSLWHVMTITRGLQAVLVALLLSVGAYAVTLREVSLSAVSWSTTKELVGIGITPAVFSALTVVVASMYVLIANALHLGKEIGLVVFGNNISTMILFGLNTVSWALASRSMQRLYGPAAKNAATQTDLADLFFRFGVIAAVLLALAAHIVFLFTLKAYAGSATYIVYLCLFQSYSLLLFSELNFLNVNSRLKAAIVGYVLMMAALAILSLLIRERFLLLLQLGIVIYCALALFITTYCRRLGFKGGPFRQRIAALIFPAACAVMYSVTGSFGVLGICLVFLVAGSFLYGEQVSAYFVGRKAL